ncbi:MAG: TIGR03086 family metal-binding protein [Pseudonocardia sp.]|nr:TIGR03086 family metal-binding protein [Pseudonocardia sp.]
MTTTQSTRLDLGPAARHVAALLAPITDDQLANPTPSDCDVATVLDHLMGLTRAFTDAARKTVTDGPAPVPSGADLDPGWRTVLPARLDALAEAWRDPAAWEGMADAGGVRMPASTMGVVALDELVLHGWDLARGTGQAYRVDAASVAACLRFVEAMAEPGQDRGGLFGPVVPVPDDAPPFHRVLGLAGRDPRWSAPTAE